MLASGYCKDLFACPHFRIIDIAYRGDNYGCTDIQILRKYVQYPYC